MIISTTYSGAAFFGYEYAENGMIVQCPEEQWTLRAIRSLRAVGYSWRRIESELANRGVEYFGLSGGRGFPIRDLFLALRKEEQMRIRRTLGQPKSKRKAANGK